MGEGPANLIGTKCIGDGRVKALRYVLTEKHNIKGEGHKCEQRTDTNKSSGPECATHPTQDHLRHHSVPAPTTPPPTARLLHLSSPISPHLPSNR